MTHMSVARLRRAVLLVGTTALVATVGISGSAAAAPPSPSPTPGTSTLGVTASGGWLHYTNTLYQRLDLRNLSVRTMTGHRNAFGSQISGSGPRPSVEVMTRSGGS